VSATLYTYYGDDFTGSTDVLEGLALAGLRSVLFLRPPTDAQRRAFSDCQAFGIAGDSRSRSPEWMNEHLPAIFALLGSFGAPIVHYKTCSTFDSSPQVGSIGRALEIGLNTLRSTFAPVVVAAPHLRRYVAFGNLFAAAGDAVYRIDRHPTMSQHPVTPMHEADLRRHLAAQTSLRIGSIELPSFQGARIAKDLAAQVASGAQVVVFDGVERHDVEETGRLLWQLAGKTPLFAAGSSGLTYGLAAAWRQDNVTAPRPPEVDRLLVLSGSCSPVTERQIRYALRIGYEGIALQGDTPQSCIAKAIAALRSNGKVILYTALGPLPPGTPAQGDELGRQIGSIAREIIRATGVRRVVLAGGDTSSHAVSQLGLHALTWIASTQPGAPLCRAHADSPELAHLELVLKGGQVGTEDFFERVRGQGAGSTD